MPVESDEPRAGIAKLPVLAALVALAGLADAIYLTVHAYAATPVPCGEGFDCEMVLTSSYSEVAGIPLAVFGAAAYFLAFSLALLTAFGDARMWRIFGVMVVLMAGFSTWLFYVQAAIIHAFCQYCLVSAGTTFTLLIIFLISFAFWPNARGDTV
jgi:uncharacterized membrane protein